MKKTKTRLREENYNEKVIFRVYNFCIFLFFGSQSVNAETIKIDTSLDENTTELIIDSDIIDLDSYIHESDSGTYIIIDHKLVPLAPNMNLNNVELSPMATTRNMRATIRNGDTWRTNTFAAYNQRVRFGNRPQSLSNSYNRRVRISSNNSNGPVYYDSTNIGGRAEIEFTVKRSPDDYISFRITHYSPTTGYYDVWLTS